jgi:hypothetical protein
MTKRTMTAEEREWDESREARQQWIFRRMNRTWREVQAQDAARPHSAVRRRLFPWRIRVERLS